jgi:hypothetical protein
MEPASRLELEHLTSELSRAVAPFIGTGRVLQSFGEHKTLLDATIKFVIRGHGGRPEFVVLCSAEGGPEIVARGVQRARETVDALGDDLGIPVLLPMAEGRVDGRTFAIFRYCTPLIASGPRWWIQRSIVRPRVVQWLLESSRKTAGLIPEHQLERCVYDPLQGLIADHDHSPDLRQQADEALRAAQAGTWQPRHVLMHGDLWVGNVLIDQRTAGGRTFGQFVIIDWAGARVRGYPFYDLLRLSISFGLARRPFARALDEYCAALNYSRAEGRYAFASAAAELGSRLEHWPRDAYLSTIDDCWRKLTSVR